MARDVDLWLTSAKADFQAAVHQSACISDIPSMCSQIENMVQSIALGLNECTEALQSMSNRLDRIESIIQTLQTPQQTRFSQQESRAEYAVAR